MIYADQRWIGNHGIGRFAKYVLVGLDYRTVPLAQHPAAPLDSWRLARALRGLTRRDLFFSPGYNSPLFCPAPFIFTIHDLGHIYCSDNTSPLIRAYYATVMKRACRAAARILTVSGFTRAQILEWSGAPPEKVVSVGCGVDPAYHPGVAPYNTPSPYILSVSNRKPHKNEFRTVEAFAMSRLAAEVQLLFTGPASPGFVRRLMQLGLSGRVRFLGTVPEDVLPSLYRGARALVFPSLYEGFGLPVLEAMACGTPVLTSNITALPETAGGAALLVNPSSVEEIAAGMKRILCDASLRERLRKSGLQRAARFSWTKTAEMVHRILRDACAPGGDSVLQPEAEYISPN